MLHVADLDAFYGQAQILYGLSIEVKEGEVVALLGRNGAGKSTVFKAIMGMLPGAAGSIAFQDRQILGRAPEAIARRGIAFMPAERRIFSKLSVRDNLKIARQGRRRGAPAWNLKAVLQLFPRLAELRGRRGDQISGGEQKLLSLARALMGNPRLLLLDEPSGGFDPASAEEIADTINYLKEEGLSVVMAEQNLRFAGAVADRAYIVDNGRTVVRGTIGELLQNDKKCEHYLER
jgi:branched-chain amino acid transport system ATP-binding protein